MVSDILWSDPNRLVSRYMESSRGCGKLFGQNIAARFLEENNLKYLIRGHQCVTDGVDFFSNCVVTVFSSSFYNDVEENKAGCLLIGPDMELTPVTLPAIQHGKRRAATFVDAPNLSLSRRGSSMVYKEPPKMCSFSPLMTVIPQFTPKKRRMSGVVSIKTLPVSAGTKSPKPIVPLPKISTPF